MPDKQSNFPFELVIFDKDGVLMLTEEIYFRSYQETILHFGGNAGYSWADHQKFMGTLSSERFLVVRKQFAVKSNLDEFLAENRRRYMELFAKEGLKVPVGVREFIRFLKDAGVKMAVVTGTSRKNADVTLNKTELITNFDVIVTADDVSQGKPDPEGFLLAASRLGVNPDKCLVIGDSINDIVGAKAAGMKVIAIVDPDYTRDPELAKPDLEVSSLKDVTFETLKSLATQNAIST